MLYLTCTIISSVALAHYGVFRAKDRVSVDCGTRHTVKNIRRFYGKITGNQLPVLFPLFFLQAPVNIFRNQAQNGSKGQ